MTAAAAAKAPLTQAALLARRCARALAAHRRRARAEGKEPDYGAAELEALAARLTLCHYCHLPFAWGELAFDHATPTSRGGPHALANLAVCCDRCNRAKGKLTASEFAQVLALLRSLPPAAGEDVWRRLLHGAAAYRGKRRK